MNYLCVEDYKNVSSKLILGTRGSKLALWQANHVKDQLSNYDVDVEIKIIKTQGDKIQHLSFDKLEGKGFFTKELEEALLANEVDFAVHSMKDLPTQNPDGLVITAISERADARDIIIIHKDQNQEGRVLGIKEGAVIGTSSIRRKLQIQQLIPGVEVKDLRGNVPTRIKKLESGDYDAIILAAAGIDRLKIDLSAYKIMRFHPREFVPAPAQGVLAYQCRTDDVPTRKALSLIHSRSTLEVTNIERGVLKAMDGGCQVPVGVYCEKDSNDFFHAYAFYHDDLHGHRNVQYSQSTTAGLIDIILEQLKSEVIS